MKSRLMATAATTIVALWAAMPAIAAGPLAQATPETRPAPERDMGTSKPAEPAPGAPPGGALQTTPPSGSAANAPLPASLEGKDVVNTAGDKIGKVEQTIGSDSLVVSVGGFLGIGAKQVLLSRDRISLTGSGDDLKVATSMSEDDLKAMPEYKSPGPVQR